MAIYDCGQDLEPNIGTVHDEVTIGYPPDALSTGVCYHTNWRPINYTELAYPPPDYEVITQAACSIPYGDPRTIDSSHILAGSPIFSIPGGISQVDPLWSTCTPAAPGGYDPPRALTRIPNLVPTPTPLPAKPEPESSAALQVPVETGAPSTTSGANVGQISQDPSDPNGNGSPDPSVTASQGAAIAAHPGSAAGNQEGSSKSQQVPSAKEGEPDPQNPGTSTVPSVGGEGNAGSSPQGKSGDTVPVVPAGKPSGSNPQNAGASSTPSEEDGGTTGSSPQDSGGNVGSSVPDGQEANIADTQASSIPDTPDSVSKGVSGSVSPGIDTNEGSNLGASLQEASGGGVKLGTVTIAPGAQTTYSGHVFSVGSSFVLVDGTSFDLQSLQSGAPPATATTTSPSQQDLSGGGVVVGTTTLAPGVQSTFSGHTISVGSSVFAVDGTSYNKASGGGFIIGTTTLPPGAQTTASGHVVSVASNAVVIDCSSYAFAAGPSSPPSTTPAGGGNLGGLILSAFGTGTTANSTASPVAFTGDAGRFRLPSGPGLLMSTMIMYIMSLYIL